MKHEFKPFGDLSGTAAVCIYCSMYVSDAEQQYAFEQGECWGRTPVVDVSVIARLNEAAVKELEAMFGEVAAGIEHFLTPWHLRQLLLWRRLSGDANRATMAVSAAETERLRGLPGAAGDVWEGGQMSEWFESPINAWFELSYARFLTVPRLVMEAMPREWQEKMAALLEEMDETFDWHPKHGRYWVRLKDAEGRFAEAPLQDYRLGSMEPLRRRKMSK